MDLNSIYEDLTVSRRVQFNIDTTEKQLLVDMNATLLRIEKALSGTTAGAAPGVVTPAEQPKMVADSPSPMVSNSALYSDYENKANEPENPSFPNQPETTMTQDVNPPADNSIIPDETPSQADPNVTPAEPTTIPEPTPAVTPEQTPIVEPTPAVEPIPEPTPAVTPETITPDVPQQETPPAEEVSTPQVEEPVNPPIEEPTTPGVQEVNNTIVPPAEEPTTPSAETTTIPPAEEQVNPTIENPATPTVDNANVEFAQEIAPKKTTRSRKTSKSKEE